MGESLELQIDQLPVVFPSEVVSSDVDAHAGRLLLFADGLSFRLQQPLSTETLRGLITIDGNEPIARNDLEQSGKIKFTGGFPNHTAAPETDRYYRREPESK